MGLTSIEWTDRTWNPVRGCSRVSQGCVNCYAEKMAARFVNIKNAAGAVIAPGVFRGFVTHRGWTGKVELIESKLSEPLHWKKPQRVFVNSMSDLFHEALPDEAINRVFQVMADCPHITFQVLTKRPERMLQWAQNGLCMKVEPHWSEPNVWLGVSVEDQATADARIPLLLQTPAAIRFVSYEPALGPVDFGSIVMPDGDHLDTLYNDGEGAGIDWIIAGGESGPGARPHDPKWFQDVRDQCIAADVPYFFKQWGEYAPMPPGDYKGRYLERVGKKKAGALLDGREWKQFPK